MIVLSAEFVFLCNLFSFTFVNRYFAKSQWLLTFEFSYQSSFKLDFVADQFFQGMLHGKSVCSIINYLQNVLLHKYIFVMVILRTNVKYKDDRYAC